MQRFILLALGIMLGVPTGLYAYVEAALPLAAVITQSTNVCTMTVTKVDKQKNLIIFRKIADVKGKHPQEEIKHNIGFGGLRPGEWQEIMNWAEVGKTAVFFHNGGASETYIGSTWYQAYPQGEWWGMSHGEPFLLRSYCGKADKLGGVVADLLAGREIVVPGMVDGDKEALHKKTARVQRLKASMKLQDYNPKRDFVGWGGEDIRRLGGMPGFDRLATLGVLGPQALAASVLDVDGDTKPDIVLAGAYRLLILHNGGDAFSEVTLPGVAGGVRAAVWGDHDADGRPDLLLATVAGPRLFTNLGAMQFRDDTNLLPRETAYNLTGAAWIDADGDGHLDVLLANGFHGACLYRNERGQTPAAPPLPTASAWQAIGPFRAPNPADNPTFAFSPETEWATGGPDLTKKHRGKRDMEVSWKPIELKEGASTALSEFGQNCVVYFVRELTTPVAQNFPIELVGGAHQTVWLNGQLVARGTTPTAYTLPLKAGKNRVLVKLSWAGDQNQLLVKAGRDGRGPGFVDISRAWGLGPDLAKADSLCVADLTGDGRADLLWGAELFVNTGAQFEPKARLEWPAAKVSPALFDGNQDGHLDLLVPNPAGPTRLFQNDGRGQFKPVAEWNVPGAVCAATGDVDGDGLGDVVLGVLRGSNRYFHNEGAGRFTDQTPRLGLEQKQWNTAALTLADLNGDGQLDLVLANEGQESLLLFGAKEPGSGPGAKLPLVVPTAGAGSRVQVRQGATIVGQTTVAGAAGRGGQGTLAPRFLLPAGTYTIAVQSAGGKETTREATLSLPNTGGPR
ncbi:MAG: FG-GAP repeat domain-containing protein [Gemmataceae bacterium]